MKQRTDDNTYRVITGEFRHASEKLEFDAVLGLVAAYATSERTADAIRGTGMLDSIEIIEKSQSEIREALDLIEGEEDFPIAGWVDHRAILLAINAEGAVSDAENLKGIAEAEFMADRIRGFLSRQQSKLPILSAFQGRFDIQNEIVSRIRGAIGPEGEIVDKASRELARIRKRIHTLRERLRKECADFAQMRGSGKGYEFVTMRGERYVVSLPRGEAVHVKGIVHQASSSGASLFVEPFEFVEQNNALESLVQEERREIDRILRELTSLVFAKRDSLLGNQEAMHELDVIRAKALFARRYTCEKPDHSSDGTLHLRSARHPLLEKRFADEGGERAARPLELKCGPELKALVISGPNAGGKTVALKTAGLVVMMDRAGLLVPCKQGTVVPDYSNLFVDIGDDQSIEKSLSTFSSRIGRIRKILHNVNEKSFVLIDEIGDGTDPEEGAALAKAILGDFIARCGRTIVTTHLAPLKGWAHETEGAENATLEFDPDNLEPLFSLRMGVPGRSWGIEMAGRMGLPNAIIERAKSSLGEETLRLEELLSHLERAERAALEQQKELERKEKVLAELIESYRKSLDSFRKDSEDLRQKAREEALEIVSSTRREMEKLIKEIRMTQAEREVIRKARKDIDEKRISFEKTIQRGRGKGVLGIGDIREGAWYEIASIGKSGQALPIKAGQNRVFLELPGGLRVETNVDDLSPAEDAREPLEPQKGYSWTGERASGPPAAELMVRGLERQEAIEKVDAFLDRAVLQGLRQVTIIHGVGRGILKRAIYDMLKKDPRVKEVHPGEPAIGGDGVAIAELK
jgi:DNA mismatch repair protein MutS2